jgi:hypothetical protein
MHRARAIGELDFRYIRALDGRRTEGFEEFCCQLAFRGSDVPAGSRFQRNRGAGGDGGVECFWELPDGSLWGWQTKYFDEFKSAQQRQLTESVETALHNYPALARYTICLPIDLTGRTVRGGGKHETFHRLQEQWEATARERLGREVGFVLWDQFRLVEALTALDTHGARRRFWFDDQVLTEEWFTHHLQVAERAAGPRYTAALSVNVPVATAFEALGRTATWEASEQQRREVLVQARDRWLETRATADRDRAQADFPENAAATADTLGELLTDLIDSLSDSSGPGWVDDLRGAIQATRDVATACEHALVEALETTHERSVADSDNFRQFQAEVALAHPAHYVDAIRVLLHVLDDLMAWATGVEPALPAAPALLVYGSAGTGKTHAFCDAARDRQRRSLRSVVIFGEQIHEGDPWDQIRVLLGFGADVSRDMLLGLLDVAGETSGYPLILFIDALNETIPRNMWKRFLAPMLEEAGRYHWLKVCLSCRTSYLDVVLPEGFDVLRVEHTGFAGVEFEAATEFFDHYGIAAPATPLLQPEFANPLFLRLVCEALQGRQIQHFLNGQLSFDEVVQLLLENKNKRVCDALNRDAREELVPRAIHQLATAMAAAGNRHLPWAVANDIVDAIGPAGDRDHSLFYQLIGEGLISEERIFDLDANAKQDVVRFAFERLADYWIAECYLDGMDAAAVSAAFAPEGRLHFVVRDHQAIAERSGLLGALALLLPEHFGLELTEVPCERELIEDLRWIVCESLAWRSLASIGAQAASELREAIQSAALFPVAMDALLALAIRSDHPLNAHWGHDVFANIPMPDRDAVLCPYLHGDWGAHSAMDRLTRGALDSNLANLTAESAELWVNQLSWFLAANDRRVRDHATKAIVRLLDQHPVRCASVLARFTAVDDDYVVERILAACYGALLRQRDNEAIRSTVEVLWENWFQPGRLPQNALIRDYARLIMELAVDTGVLPPGIEPDVFRPPYDSEWPLTWPSKKDIEIYRNEADDYPRLYWSCVDDDFLVYTLVGTFGAYESIAPSQAGRWILQHVIDMGYTPECFAAFDREMIRRFGAGRSRPAWAERIGKKYQWIALYRLLARVADHLEPKGAAWVPDDLPDRPLQALGQRNIDPSHWLRPSVATEPDYADLAPVFGATERLSDEELLRQGDLPDTRSLLQNPRPCQGSMVLPVTAKFRCESQPTEAITRGAAYRSVVVDLTCYLVQEQDLEGALTTLREMRIGRHAPPEAASLKPTFLGEYPSTVEARRTLAIQAPHPEHLGYVPGLTPVDNYIVNDFELDAFTGKALSIHVPAPIFFERDQLAWDRSTGFLDATGQRAFANPSTDGWDPVSFVVEVEYLRKFLREHQYVALWVEQVARTAFTDQPPGRQYIDVMRCHIFDGVGVRTVIEREIESHIGNSL